MRLFLLSSFLLFVVSLWSQQPLTCDDQFILNGSAVLEEECIRLTTTSTGLSGCAWFEDLVDFSMPLSHTMTLNFGTIDANGADGICLVYQANNTAQCGGTGENIAAAGIPNSFIVEFDTWQNPNVGDPFNDHASISQNGDLDDFIEPPFELPNLEDGNDYEVVFNWDPATNTYEVILDGTTIFSGNYDIINNCFGGNTMVYWGYTASTGGSTNEQRVCPGLPEQPEAEAEDGELPCVGALLTIDGTESDTGPDFTYEWTTNDGNIVAGDDTLEPEVDAPGTYTLTIFNTVTLCENTIDVEITAETLIADIVASRRICSVKGKWTVVTSQ